MGAIDMMNKRCYEANQKDIWVQVGIGPRQVDGRRLMKMGKIAERGASEDNVSKLFVLNS